MTRRRTDQGWREARTLNIHKLTREMHNRRETQLNQIIHDETGRTQNRIH